MSTAETVGNLGSPTEEQNNHVVPLFNGHPYTESFLEQASTLATEQIRINGVSPIQTLDPGLIPIGDDGDYIEPTLSAGFQQLRLKMGKTVVSAAVIDNGVVVRKMLRVYKPGESGRQEPIEDFPQIEAEAKKLLSDMKERQSVPIHLGIFVE